MRIRFGFVSHALSIYEATPSRTMTFKRYSELADNVRKEQLKALTLTNLRNTKRALMFCIAAEIPLYRFSSSLVPLATHPEVNWDYLSPFKREWRELGELVKKFRLRVSFHPGQYTLFTSTEQKIIDNTQTDLTYHYQMLEAMGLEKEGFINIHVGGAYGNKAKAVERFHQNFAKLDAAIKGRMTIENDDKTYTGEEALVIAEAENIPLMFDYHHELANRSEVPYETFLQRALSTWSETGFPPKVHLSSPKSDKQYRNHADFVDVDYALPFLKACKKETDVLDVMIEAKQKDRAALQFIEEITKIRGIKRIAGGIIEL